MSAFDVQAYKKKVCEDIALINEGIKSDSDTRQREAQDRMKRLLQENICLKQEIGESRELYALFSGRDGHENMMRRAKAAAKLLYDNKNET